jgi:hypothetical protein
MTPDDLPALQTAASPLPGFGGRPCSQFNPDMARYRRMEREGLVEIKPWTCGDSIVSATEAGRRALNAVQPKAA